MNGSVAAMILSSETYQRMLAHCLACLPEEACGLLGGSISGGPERLAQARVVLPIANLLHSPVRFRMDPLEQLKAFQWLDAQSLDLVGIFHSHPTGPEHPSATDLDEFAYPGVFTLIVFPRAEGLPLDDPAAWQVRAFDITGEPPDWTDIPVRGMDGSHPGQP